MSRLPWLLVAVSVALAITGLAASAAGAVGAWEAFAGVLLTVFAVVGAVVVSARGGNAVGWLFLAVGLAATVQILAEGYLNTGPDPNGSTAAMWAGWYDSWGNDVWLPLGAIFVPLLFPDGRLPSPRWRPLLGLAVAGAILACLAAALKPGKLDAPGVDRDNPLGVPDAAGALDAAAVVATALLALGAATAAASLVVRFRRSHDVERQQVKWFVFVATLMLAAGLLAGAAGAVDAGWADILGAIGWFSLLALLVIGMPIAVGTAIFRYRLYDIDVVINRALVYGALSALLGGSYVGLVLLLQLVLQPLTGGSELAVAFSTLAVAALFRPARARVQGLVDRRFYRRKYDAERTLAAFAVRLRDEVDLDALRGELAGVVAETMQPAHVSVWLRRGGAR